MTETELVLSDVDRGVVTLTLDSPANRNALSAGLVGGIGVYAACCGHGPFTHVDVRGFRARWRGSGSG